MNLGKNMQQEHKSDLHCHLNGSFSDEFLEKTAVKNGCLQVFAELMEVKEKYFQLTKQQPQEGFSLDSINLIWKQFALVHKIVRDLEDIKNGVVDVVSHSVKYLEIRTTPKEMGNETIEQYIESFEQGLIEANQVHKNKKAVGLLSLDRTIHTVEDARRYIHYIKKSPHGVLVGLDISGNPIAKRTLSGKDLEKVIQLAFANQLPIAIHMGECDSGIERQDTDIVLAAIEQFAISEARFKQGNPLHGKVRLGHCIFLSKEQKEKIRELQAPIEVCPTCHSKLNWHLEKSVHPVTEIYNDISAPIIPGTDDAGIFGSSGKKEFAKCKSLFFNKHQLEDDDIKNHQAKFRFSNP
ncbi:hypothetical protein ELY14_02985 [Legionella septentrionalis]|nr:hypothetical protein ELY14_02985 [Legionella septentrionalis]